MDLGNSIDQKRGNKIAWIVGMIIFAALILMMVLLK